MELNVKIYLEEQGNKFMGIGVLWLMRKIKEKGSLRAAASDMNISYSKAYKMICNLEDSLGKEIVFRQRGGQNRSGICLTPFAEQFMELYDNFQKESKDKLKEQFSDFKSKLEELYK